MICNPAAVVYLATLSLSRGSLHQLLPPALRGVPSYYSIIHPRTANNYYTTPQTTPFPQHEHHILPTMPKPRPSTPSSMLCGMLCLTSIPANLKLPTTPCSTSMSPSQRLYCLSPTIHHTLQCSTESKMLGTTITLHDGQRIILRLEQEQEKNMTKQE